MQSFSFVATYSSEWKWEWNGNLNQNEVSLLEFLAKENGEVLD